MINLNAMPCSNCKNYLGVKWRGAEEETEFVSCSEASSADAKELISVNGMRILCAFQEKLWDDEN